MSKDTRSQGIAVRCVQASFNGLSMVLVRFVNMSGSRIRGRDFDFWGRRIDRIEENVKFRPVDKVAW